MPPSTQGAMPLGLPVLLCTLAGVYTTQSLIGVFTLQGIPAVLRAEGITTTKIGLFYLALLPWALKFIWAPTVEKLRKNNLTFCCHAYLIMGSQWLIALILTLFIISSPFEYLPLLFIGVLILTLLSTIADITADGLAIDQLPIHKRSIANVLQVGGSYLGAILGGGLFIYLSGSHGWETAIIVLLVAVIIMSLPSTQLRKKIGTPKTSDISNRPSLGRAFGNPIIRKGIFWVLVCQLGTRSMLAMLMPFMIDQGLELKSLGILAVGGGAVASLAGVLAGGVLLQRINAGTLLALALIMEGIVCIALLKYSISPISLPYCLEMIFVIISVVSAIKFVALYTLMMHWSEGSQSGVDFSLLQSADMFIAISTAVVGGWLVFSYGYPLQFGIALIATVCAISLFIYSYRKNVSCARLTPAELKP